MSTTITFPPPRNPNDLGRGPMVIGLTWTFTGLALITTLLRLYVRKRIGPHFAADDWLMAGAIAFQLVGQIFVTIAFHYGMGKHEYDLWIPGQLVPMAMWEWLAVAPGIFATILARISICILLIRLFGVHKWFKVYAIVLTTLGVISAALATICLYASRHPVQSLWDPFIPNATQWPPEIVHDMMFLVQSLYAFADLTFVIISIIIIWKLNMPLGRRLGLIALMAMGLFTCAMSIMKGVSAIDGQTGPDATYTSSISLLWATLEQAFVVLLGNVAPLWPLVKLDFPIVSRISQSMVSLLGWTSRSTRGTSKQSPSGKPAGYGSGAYQDLEMNRYKVDSRTHGVWHEVVKDNGSSDGSSVRGFVDGGQVRRTDAFTITYDQSNARTSPLPPR